MITHNENEEIQFDDFSMQTFLTSLFLDCKNTKEVNFIKKQIIKDVELIAGERLNDL